MRFNTKNPDDINRLASAIHKSHGDLDGFRTNRTNAISEFTGSYYTEAKSTNEMPVNMLALTVDIYQMYLAGDTPQVLLLTSNPSIKPVVADLEAAVNQEIKDINLGEQIRQWVLEAIFGLGVMKCGLVDAEYRDLETSNPTSAEEYYCEVISVDDFAFDTSAESFGKASWIANRYRVDKDALLNSGFADKAIKEATSEGTVEDTISGDQRASDISNFDAGPEDDKNFVESVEVWDVWIPDKGLLVTLPNRRNCSVPLRVVEWDGPERGPYHFLDFQEVPGNAMPLAPAQLLRSLNKAENAIFRKLTQQARRQKTIGLVQSGSNKDAQKIQKARDGDLVPVDDPRVVNEVSFGGPSPENLAFGLQIDQLFSRMAGNLDAMGGLGAQADTASQEQMIGAAASKKAGKMARRVVDATVGLIEDMITYMWSDTTRTYTAARPIASTTQIHQVQLRPSDRVGDLPEMVVKVEPYSMQYRAPQQRSQELLQVLQFMQPMLPMFQQQGLNLNPEKLFRHLSKLMSMPELEEMFESVAPPVTPSADDSNAPAVTHRTNERISRSAGAERGERQNMISQLMSQQGGDSG